jgi:hypothetical protein
MKDKKGFIKLVGSIALLMAVSISANTSKSQTKDTIPPRDTKLIERLKVLNTIEAQQKQKKEKLYDGLDSSVVELKEMVDEEEATGKVIDENRRLIKRIAAVPVKPHDLRPVVMMMPSIQPYEIRVTEMVLPCPEPEVVLERSKKQNWLKRIFKFL